MKCMDCGNEMVRIPRLVTHHQFDLYECFHCIKIQKKVRLGRDK